MANVYDFCRVNDKYENVTEMENNYSINLVLDYLDNVNFAIVQCRSKVCRWCIVENRMETDINNFKLKFEGDYIETYTSDEY